MESQIEKLKQKYWEGNTTVEEEKILKTQIKKENSQNLESKFFIELENRKSVKSKIEFSIPKKKNRILWQLGSIAATIIVLVAFAIGYNNYNKPSHDQFAIDDPHQAYEISLQALMLVSNELNKGKTYSTRIDKINEVKNSMNK